MKPFVYVFLGILGIGIVGELGVLQFPFLPSTKPLSQLVTKGQGRELSEFYNALATVVAKGDIATTSGFRNTQILAAQIMQRADPGSMVGLSRINEPINQRLTNAIGVDGEIPDADITEGMRAKLTQALQEISKDFR